ncbi:CPCC family cysteine-rich protein [Nocardia fusca]|uniref:CPCC family cysteine-rich protein n=1 Tax=Nocardia fusca TaxID=941183 RepID=A0ABV3F632_9NOCA
MVLQYINALKWPVIAALAIFFFHTPVRTMLRQVQRLRVAAFGAEAEIERQAEVLAADVAAAADRVQLRWPTIPGGANRISLVETQRDYRDFSACDDTGRTHARSPEADEPLDPAWRPIDPARDHFEDPRTGLRQPWPDDPTTLYWWLPTFWRRNAHNK